MLKRIIILTVLLLTGCTNVYKFIDRYIEDHTARTRVSTIGRYTATFHFENAAAKNRTLIAEYPHLQKLTHELVPDSIRFYDVTVFVPASQKSWEVVKRMIGKKASAFTLFTDYIYVVFQPDYWGKGSNRDLRKTAVHELMHHVSIEIYEDGDPNHKREEFWDPGGLIDQILAEYKESR